MKLSHSTGALETQRETRNICLDILSEEAVPAKLPLDGSRTLEPLWPYNEGRMTS